MLTARLGTDAKQLMWNDEKFSVALFLLLTVDNHHQGSAYRRQSDDYPVIMGAV